MWGWRSSALEDPGVHPHLGAGYRRVSGAPSTEPLVLGIQYSVLLRGNGLLGVYDRTSLILP